MKMNRVGYNLPPLPFPPAHMPVWEGYNALATQTRMDNQYLHGPGGLDNFYDQADSWIDTQVMSRANSGDPGSYVAAPFQMKIPRRQICAYDALGNSLPDVFADPDPQIQMPVLPAYVAPAASVAGGPGIRQTAPPDEMILRVLGMLMAKMNDLEQRMNRAGIGVALLLCLLLFAPHAVAQVVVKVTPEPMAVPTAVLANARDLGRNTVELCNTGAAQRQLYWEQVSLGTAIRFVDSMDAAIVLASHQNATKAAKTVKALQWGMRGGAIALAIFTRSAASSHAALNIIAGLTTGEQVLPEVLSIVQGEAPSAAPLLSALKWPISVAGGACITDHVFAAKVRAQDLKATAFTIP